MKDLNDFINRANSFKSGIRQSNQNSALINTSSNDSLIRNVDDDYEVFEEGLKEDSEEIQQPIQCEVKPKMKGKKGMPKK